MINKERRLGPIRSTFAFFLSLTSDLSIFSTSHDPFL